MLCSHYACAGDVALLENGVVIDTLEAPAILGEYVLLSGMVENADERPFSIRCSLSESCILLDLAWYQRLGLL